MRREIIAFKKLGKADRIIVVVIDGEPDAVAQWLTNGRGNPRRECLPFVLRYGQPSVADVRGGRLAQTFRETPRTIGGKS